VKRRTRKNPTATIRDFTEGPLIPDAVVADLAGRDMAATDAGEGAVQFTLGGVDLGDPFPLPGAAWSGVTGRPNITYVSRFIPSYPTKKAAIEAAIAEAATKPSGIVDFEGVNYATESTVTINNAGVTLRDGGIVPTGQFPALAVQASDVTVQRMTFSRSTSSGVLDSSFQRSCVSVNAERFLSVDCHYLAANHACVYFNHANCNGSTIRGGSMRGVAARQDASGVYVAPGTTGNLRITIEGVLLHDMPQGVLMYDASYCVVRNNRALHLRKLPMLALTGWTNVSGNVWRQRSASGTAGVDGPTTDRNDGNTRVVYVNGTYTGEVAVGNTTPGTNQAGIDGGYVYINLGGVDPNTRTIESGILSGYAYMIYVTGANEGLACYNKFVDNYAEDVDGFGVYFQLGNNPGAVGNESINSQLKNVCLEGRQHPSLAFAGIGVGGGSDTHISGGIIDGVGGPTKQAPAVDVIPGTANTTKRGRISNVTVRNGSSQGFQIRASGWILNGCQAHENTANGFVVIPTVATDVVNNVELNGCHASKNGGEGIFINGTTATTGYVSARVNGGAVYDNTQRGILLRANGANQTVRDSAVLGVELRENGNSSFPQVSIRDACQRTIVNDCNMVSAKSSAIGLQMDATAVDTAVGINLFSLAVAESLAAGVRRPQTPRVGSVASSGTPAINTNNVDQFNITALGGAITSMSTNLSGTPTDGQRLRIRFKDNGVARSITWGASFTGTLLATTVANKTHVQDLAYDPVVAKWVGTYADTVGY